MLIHCEDDMKSLLLRHGFCLLLKSCKEQIQGVLNSLDENEKIKYVLNFELINEENSLNEAIKEQTYLFEFINAALDVLDVLSLKTALISELSHIPGYDKSYGFIDVNYVSDLIMSAQLKIELEKSNDGLVVISVSENDGIVTVTLKGERTYTELCKP